MSSIITNVRIFPSDKGGSQLAYGTFTVAGAFDIQFSYMKGSKGNFVSLPAYKKADGTYNNQVTPIVNEEVNFKVELQKEVEAAYNALSTKKPANKDSKAPF